LALFNASVARVGKDNCFLSVQQGRLWGERLDLLTNKPANVVTLRAA
jgi:hypothetical protein